MRVPFAWLQEYVDLPDPLTVAEKLAALGFPVATIEQPPKISGVVVGRITALSPHPNADRLQLCTIDINAEHSLTIATAATNVAQGQTVPVAQIGAQLPEMRIEPRKMRGVDSQGMLCSAAELGLPAAWFEDGILQLDTDLPIGSDVVGLFGLDQPVLDVEVTTNRPDALSLLGLARELSAAFGVPLRQPTCADFSILSLPSTLRLELASPDAVEVIGLEVSAITQRPSPMMRRIRLAQAGIRPIDALVDCTNFVMLELGRPTHLYDAAHIEAKTLIFRDAHADEHLTTLDGVDRSLTPLQLVVADSEKPLALAGMIGGAATGIHSTTTNAILECGQFANARIRRGAAGLGVRTEASARFEKGLAHATLEHSASRLAYLLAELGATVHQPVRVGITAPKHPAIQLKAGAVQRLLGIDPSPAQIQQSLQGLGCTVEPIGLDFQVIPPLWRTDLTASVDLVEEIARMLGYNQLESQVAAVSPTQISSQTYRREHEAAHTMQRHGFTEIITLALEPGSVRERFSAAGCAPDRPSVEIRNPLSEDQQYLRFSLLPEMLNHLARRRNELSEGPLQFFEIGNRFFLDDAPCEIREVLFCYAQRATTGGEHQDAAFYALKTQSETVLHTLLGYLPRFERTTQVGFHPGKTARCMHAGEPLATIGMLDPRLSAAYDLDAAIAVGVINLKSLPDYQLPRYLTPSRYPSLSRDLAFLIAADVEAQRLVDTICQADPLARQVRVFDAFSGAGIPPGKKSLTVRIAFQRDEATLTDDDADRSVAHILATVDRELGAQLRR